MIACAMLFVVMNGITIFLLGVGCHDKQDRRKPK